jgi:transcription elongation factor Elf1
LPICRWIKTDPKSQISNFKSFRAVARRVLFAFIKKTLKNPSEIIYSGNESEFPETHSCQGHHFISKRIKIMSSTKCAQCGLVNFSTAVQCKRCRQPLNEMSAFADQRAYQQNQPPPVPQNNYQQPFQTPPPPPVFDNGYDRQFNQPPANFCCIKCGSRTGVTMQNFKKTYTPPVAYLGILIGPLIFLILALVLRVRHQLNAPFCASCWSGFKNLGAVSTLLNLACILVLMFGVAAGMMNQSFGLTVFSIILGVAFGIASKVYESKVAPKYKKVDGKVVVIDAPAVGEVAFYR